MKSTYMFRYSYLTMKHSRHKFVDKSYKKVQKCQPSRGCPKYTIETSVFPQTADIAGYSFLSGRPRNATPKNSQFLSKARVLSSQSKITRMRSPTCTGTMGGKSMTCCTTNNTNISQKHRVPYKKDCCKRKFKMLVTSQEKLMTQIHVNQKNIIYINMQINKM